MTLYHPGPLEPDLKQIFQSLNEAHFESSLKLPELRWNSRLKTCAGRFFPGVKRFVFDRPPAIEIARYLIEYGDAQIRDTLAHEMIHYWLWSRRRPCGHTEEFLIKMKEMGVSRYNTVPKQRPHRYLYRCPECSKDYPARKRLKNLACAACCRTHTKGQFSRKFALIFIREL